MNGTDGIVTPIQQELTHAIVPRLIWKCQNLLSLPQFFSYHIMYKNFPFSYREPPKRWTLFAAFWVSWSALALLGGPFTTFTILSRRTTNSSRLKPPNCDWTDEWALLLNKWTNWTTRNQSSDEVNQGRNPLFITRTWQAFCGAYRTYGWTDGQTDTVIEMRRRM